jgi:hypothetical protein
VTTTKTDSEIIELVLASFQKELRPFRRSLSARMADRLLFRPPPMPVVVWLLAISIRLRAVARDVRRGCHDMNKAIQT